MAIIPKNDYTGRIDSTDPEYPQGKAINIIGTTVGTGTPVEEKWLNDDWGFKQGILSEAGITPSGTPDKVGTSQYLEGIKKISSEDIINDLSQTYTFKTVGLMQSSLIEFPIGKKIFWQGYYVESDGGSNWGIVQAGVGIGDGGSEFALADGKHASANLKSRVSVKKFGAVADGISDDTLRIQGVIDYCESSVKAKTIYVPTATYATTSTLTINAPNIVFTGDGKSSVIEYNGGAGQVLLVGNTSLDPEVFTRNQTVSKIFIKVKNKLEDISGIVLERAIHFKIDDVTVWGGGSPNEQIVLQGSGIHITRTSFIGQVNKADVRLFNNGISLSTPGAASYDSGWAAAIEITGQGELHNNNIGLLVTGTGGTATANSVSVNNITIEGNYEGGIRCVSGNSVTIDTVYFEENAGYNVDLDNTVSATVVRCNSVSVPLFTTPYGSVPYLGHVIVRASSTLARIIDNNFAINPPDDFSMVVISNGSNSARVKDNRFAGAPATFDKLRDESANSIVKDNLGVADLEWVTPALSNGWGNVVNRPVLQYALDKTSSERQTLFRGVCGSGASGQVAFTLPDGTRPPDRYDFSGVNNNRVTITTAGSVIPTSSTSEVSFAGVSFVH